MNAPTTLSFSSDADQKLKIGKIIKGAVKVVKKVAKTTTKKITKKVAKRATRNANSAS